MQNGRVGRRPVLVRGLCRARCLRWCTGRYSPILMSAVTKAAVYIAAFLVVLTVITYIASATLTAD